MGIQGLLAALFLHLIQDENGVISEVLSSRIDSSVIKDIIKKEGYDTLVPLIDALTDAYSDLDSACNGEEVRKAEKEIDRLTTAIEEFI